MSWFRRFFTQIFFDAIVRRMRRERPRQLPLPFFCEIYGEECGPFYHLNSGFYGRCVKCGVTYDPVNDR